MKIFKRKPKVLTAEQAEEIRVQEFFDRISPSTVKFFADKFICGNSYKSVWAVREYPPSTEEQAILSHLADRSGVTLRIYNRLVDSSEQRQIIQHAARRNKLMTTVNDVTDSIEAENNLKDVVQLIADLRRNKEPLLHTAVFIELKASDEEKLKVLQSDILMELTRSKITVDKLVLRQKEGMLSALPFGHNAFGTLFERVLPASAVANLYPLNYSGKTDEKGFYIGRDKFGTNILVDFDKRSDDKTNANVFILGNSGQGKSYLMKLVLTNMRESGKSIICLDPEAEYEDLTNNLGGTYLDLMSGEYMINPLEPKSFGEAQKGDNEPETFRKVTRLSQHISYLKDFFRTYKDFTDAEIDTIEIMLMKLYARFDIDDLTDLDKLKATDYPVMEDLYNLIEKEYMIFDHEKKHLYTEENLQNICLGLHSMCKGADAQFFNGHTNITSSRFLVFGVKGMLSAAKNVRNAMLFNVLSFMSDKLLTVGNTVAALDELYIWLSNPTAIEYIRNCLKRVRKKESAMLLASQNLEDFDQEGVREMTKPLFSIPPHQFLFNAGSIDKRSYMDMLQLEESEYNLIKFPQRGVCLYKCGNERYLLEVHAPAYKEKLFGTAGGR